MKQTAVEWLVEEISEKYNFRFATYYGQEIQQAKEMEKQQQGYSGEEVENIMAETWIQCVVNDGNDFKGAKDKILKQFKTDKIMEQTAVEWLINEMHKKEQGLIETSYNHLFDQAKEMEKQQIIDAHGNKTKKSSSFDRRIPQIG